MSNIEIDNIFEAEDPKFEIYKQLMHEEALRWVKQPGTNYQELLSIVFRNYETAFANNGEIAIPDNNTRPVFVDASGETPQVVNGPVIVETHGGPDDNIMPPNWFTYEGDMYTTLDKMLEKEALGGEPAQRSSRRR